VTPVQPIPGERLRQMQADIERHQRAIARHRDALLVLGAELSDLIGASAQAVRALESATRYLEAQR
jgi:hypothetical protein